MKLSIENLIDEKSIISEWTDEQQECLTDFLDKILTKFPKQHAEAMATLGFDKVKIGIEIADYGVNSVYSNQPHMVQAKVISKDAYSFGDTHIYDVAVFGIGKMIYENFTDHSDHFQQETYHDLKNMKF